MANIKEKIEKGIMNFKWTNLGMKYVMGLDTERFTTDTGMNIRSVINPLVRKVTTIATKRRILLENRGNAINEDGSFNQEGYIELTLTTKIEDLVRDNFYPKLDPNKAYIFVCTHSFDEDIISPVNVIDRNTYLLLGTPDQILHNPQMYISLATGMIPVDKENDKDRGTSVDKIVRVQEHENSTIMWPEGTYNHSVNKPIESLFGGVMKVVDRTGHEVVQIIAYSDYGSKDIHMQILDPVDLTEFTITEEKTISENIEEASKKARKMGTRELEHQMGFTMAEMIYKYGEVIPRKLLAPNARALFMEQRRQAYYGMPGNKPRNWTPNPKVWGVEISPYRDRSISNPDVVMQEIWDNAPEVKGKRALTTTEEIASFEEKKREALAGKVDNEEHDVKAYMQSKAIEERDALEAAKATGFKEWKKLKKELKSPLPYISLRTDGASYQPYTIGKN